MFKIGSYKVDKLRQMQNAIFITFFSCLFMVVPRLKSQDLDTAFIDVHHAEVKEKKGQLLEDVHFRIDTATYSLTENSILHLNERKLYFYYQSENPVIEVHLFLKNGNTIDLLQLQSSGDFRIVEPILALSESHLRFKVQYYNLSKSRFTKFDLKYQRIDDDQYSLETIPVLPLHKTTVALKENLEDFYIGEEKVLPIQSNNVNNIRAITDWQVNNGYEYKILAESGQLNLHVIPTIDGDITLDIPFTVYQPILISGDSLVYDYLSLHVAITSKKYRLRFLNIYKPEILYTTENQKMGIEVEMEGSRHLKMNTIYRIEAKPTRQNPLIAEILPKERLANNRVLCLFRPYALHRKSEGTLYIKEGQSNRFLTNINIVPKPSIDKVEILSPGKDWSSRLKVHPGQNVEIKMSGKSLHNSKVTIEGLFISPDSIQGNSEHVLVKTRIPINTVQKKLPISINHQKTPWSLGVQELEVPRAFDYIMIDYGSGPKRLSRMRRNEPYEGLVDDIIFSFDYNLIDRNVLHGIQHLSINVTLRDRNNSLVDQVSIDDLSICPGESSPRHVHYNKQNCQLLPVNINDYLRRKTHELTDWDYIEIEVRSKKTNDQKRIVKKTSIILKRKVTFDLDVSFPGGLLIKRFGRSELDNLGGISMSMIGQFTFYKPSSKAIPKPYKVGAGFLAFNAFNFNAASENRDVAFVALGSIHPVKTKSRSRLSFPLFFGGGYFLSKKEITDANTGQVESLPRWFILLGPGIRVKL